MREEKKISPLLKETSTNLDSPQVWVGLIEVEGNKRDGPFADGDSLRE